MIKQYIDICEKSFLVGSFVPIFRGDEGFCLSNRNLPADVPTDWSAVIRFGLYDYYFLKKDRKIINMCRDSIIQLLNGEAFEIWCAYNICFFLLGNEYKKQAPFIIMDHNMIDRLKNALNSNAALLKTARIWNGKNLPEGLWTDICFSSKVLKMRYQIDIIQE